MIKQIKKLIINISCGVFAISAILLAVNFASTKQEKSNTNQQAQVIKYVDQTRLINDTYFGKRYKIEMESITIKLTSEMSELHHKNERLRKELDEQNSLLNASENLNSDAKKAIEDNINGLKNELRELQKSAEKKQQMYKEAAATFEQKVSEIFKKAVDTAVEQYTSSNYISAIMTTQATLYLSQSDDITDELIELVNMLNNGENISDHMPNLSFNDSETQNINTFENNFG